MDFLALSLPEAAYLYMGLAIQALVRQSSLRQLPRILVLLWTLVLVWRAQGRPDGYRIVVGYLGTSLLLCILFWPEAVPFGRVVGHTTAPTQVASYAASQDPGAEIITADDTGHVPDSLREPILLAPGFRLLLRAIMETPLALARTINTQTHRTFASLLPMQWLLGISLTTEVTAAIADWVQNCYLPVQTGTMEGREGRTIEELLPWGNTPLRRGLATREVVPGAQTGIVWLRGTTRTTTVRCDTYLDAVEARTQGWLYELKSPRGTPLGAVFQEELGLDAQAQARFLVYREMIRASASTVPAPSLTGQYAGLRGGAVLGHSLERGIAMGAAGAVAGTVAAPGSGTAVGGFLGFLGGLASGAVGGAGKGLALEYQRVVDSLSWLVGLAVFLTWWGPYLIGLVNLVLLGLFPFVMLWALIPGTQFQPLAQYFVALLFTSSMPLWWALVDVAARQVGGATAPHQTTGYAAEFITWVTAGLWSSATMALGILLVPVITAILMFSVFRAIGHLWRGGL
jgi:hypothetical protein